MQACLRVRALRVVERDSVLAVRSYVGVAVVAFVMLLTLPASVV